MATPAHGSRCARRHTEIISQGADRSTPDSFACDAADGLSNVGVAHHLSHYQRRLALVPLWIAEDLCMSNMSQARSSKAEFDMQLQCLSHVPIPEDLHVKRIQLHLTAADPSFAPAVSPKMCRHGESGESPTCSRVTNVLNSMPDMRLVPRVVPPHKSAIRLLHVLRHPYIVLIEACCQHACKWNP